MNKPFLITFLLFTITVKSFSQSSDTTNPGDKGIKFEQNIRWEQVLKKAKAENKYIFVDCYATWCGPCKMMDKDVYPSESIGNVMKDKFISVKVQMDSTGVDNEQVKSWYADARKMNEAYKIQSYPSFLFFTPDGKLVHKDLGYKSVADFTRLIIIAIDPRKPMYFAQLEDYKKGKKDYPQMGHLAIFTKDLIGDKALANAIAKDYKKNYLDKLSEEDVCKRENLDFIEQFHTLINSKDPFFQLCYAQPEKIDQVKEFEGWADFQVEQTITREEIEGKILKDGKPFTKSPGWNKILLTISKKYKRVDAKKLVLDYQIRFYRYIMEDWAQWFKYKDQSIKSYPPKSGGLEVYIQLNAGTWEAFLYCNDKSILIQTLNWIDLAIKLEENQAYFDTKANLLYKLGRIREAISVQEKAVEMSRNLAEKQHSKAYLDKFHAYSEVLAKMKKGEPTYLDEGAVWDANTLPLKKN